MCLSILAKIILSSREIIKTEDFRDGLSESIQECLSKRLLIGRRIKGQQEWGALIDSLSIKKSITAIVHIESESNLEKILNKMEESEEKGKYKNIIQYVVFTTPKHKEKPFLEIIKNWSRKMPNNEHRQLYVGVAPAGLSVTVIDQDNWYFTATENRERGIYFENDHDFGYGFENLIKKRWIESGEAKRVVI